ncbi:substrate-binding domain-containing protein [Treponema primitia]|uniref:substrate-binding domain-containing protein n=1 Tax=Treponema primitia TaxID=88058 RepID=UPI003980DB77
MKRFLLVSICLAIVTSLVMAGGGNDSSQAQKNTPSAAATAGPAAGSIMSTGPHGEQASAASDLSLSADELAKIKAGNYKVAISFHYAGNDWSTAQLQGLKDQFAKMGINVISTTDAGFRPEKQISDIENALTLKPDAIVSIPVDVVSSEAAFKQASRQGIKIVFMDNCPDNMTAGVDYTSVVSADNYGNGVAAAEVMGDALGGKGKIAMVFHDANFFVTNQRDNAFRRTIKEKYPNIQIVEEIGFDDENKGAELGDALLVKHPDLNGIYATWDIPAEGVVSAIRAAGRNNVIVSTIDLGDNVAKIIAEGGIIKGLGAQRPYDQGVAEATLIGYALIGKVAPAYVALPALKVTHSNVLEAYKDIYHKDAPADIKNAYK